MQAWLAQGALYNGEPITTGTEPWLHWCRIALAPGGIGMTGC
jgi:hypothetical protein